ncbi:helix-turn-helix domain-containing protein [Sphingomonas sp. H39-1-10]|uniref:winged helix-turn-helix transcriptional regulator n=1 Tax=Sphingomonas pollutisoli TaxID=3030829 RepID=UPI0023B9B7A2|nr:helix-turn-helix domain-containing protein [Sphingomonas pollutisoli]MDF0490427.1 helix-turn-helix domain-containing protein [Sphingomonas pollutisoli]
MAMPAPPDQPGTDGVCQRVNRMFGRIGDKWTILVVTMLMDRPRRFNELKRLIGGISQQMLSRTLRSLEHDGLVTRTVHPSVPPQVEYGLTPLGQSLAQPLTQLAMWMLSHLDEIEQHRALRDMQEGQLPAVRLAEP